MAEEFQESDIIFSDDGDVFLDYRDMIVQHNTRTSRANTNSSGFNGSRRRRKKKSAKAAPVNIPENVFPYVDSDEFEEEYDGEGDIIPPHVIVKRRIEGEMAPFSVHTGIGRTLKGRDLSRVRNSILRMTGFLET